MYMRFQERGDFEHYGTVTKDFLCYEYIYLMLRMSDCFDKYKILKTEIKKYHEKCIKSLI